ncbi:MAG TPA: carbon-nitrogen hydrolase family protein [Ktedonobacterales bacterium]|nr:carbon-nitrogen hydrolase family protein [Ktedonobacterales bacterium]
MALRVAAVQMNSGDDKAANVAQAEELIERAAQSGAQLIALPELWTYLGPTEGNQTNAEPIPGPTIERLAALARRHHVTLHCGSMLERADTPGVDPRPYNTAAVLDHEGRLIAKYRKIHLFDADPVGSSAPYRESDGIQPGNEIVTFEAEGLRIGLTTCYDLRFPELFRILALRGVQMIIMGSAFTLQTGRDHWEVLVRARAIENGLYLLAPDQVGAHPPKRVAYGRSMIVDPWGTVIAQAPDVPGVITAEISLERLADVRRQIPSLANRQPRAYQWAEEALQR